MAKKVVLAYSGGLDTSYCVKYLSEERGLDVYAITVNTGGFTDEELKQLDKFVRENTVDRFGPVRAVTARPNFGLVMEVAFEGLNRSSRHKSGIAMRFPRISRLRWDKPPAEADTLKSTLKLLQD